MPNNEKLKPNAWMPRRLRNYWGSFSYFGLVFATLFFAGSVTPSFLPRTYIVQGILSGFALAIGYGVGNILVWCWLFLELPKPSEKLDRISSRITTVTVAVVLIYFIRQMTFWQNSIRELMTMPELESAYPVRVTLIAIVCSILLITMARCVIFGFNYVIQKLNRFLPQRVAYILSFAIVAFSIMFLLNDVVAKYLLSVADNFFAKMDEVIDEGVQQPKLATYCGSPESHIHWESIGRRGKNFIVDGPTVEELTQFSDHEAKQPIRVYAGLRSSDDLRERATLALEELIRVGGFERSLLVIANPTGTGWLDPGAVNTLEYLHNGDTAIVSMQYSYLPSWLTILVDPDRSKASTQVLFDVVYDYWTKLPKTGRPRLYLHGLSLGAYGSVASSDLITTYEDPIQGAVWSGTPFPTTQLQNLIQRRNTGTPVWFPEISNGAMIRFTGQENSLNDGRRWGPIRCVYIQYASDPMVFFSPDSFLIEPMCLQGNRGPDVSPYLRWYPIVTFLQTAFDLPMATSVPIGYGHNYSPANYIDAWLAVTAPENWDAEEITRLKAHLAE